jgi:MFS transporter, DHA2 family, multidrug resistance protein
MPDMTLAPANTKPPQPVWWHRWLGAAAVFTGGVMGTMDTFVLYVAMPHLRGVFSVTPSEISWISTSYAIAALVCMLVSGWLTARFGRKQVYQSAIVVFIAASAVCGLSDSLEALIALRVVQGGAAGILLAVEIMILRQTFGPHEIGKVMGLYGATIMVGPGLGPILGGWIIDHYHWSHIFYLNLPIGALGFLLVQRFVPPDTPDPAARQARFDLAGLVLLVVGVFCLIWLLERGDRLQWFEAGSNVALLWAACAALALFVAHELMTPAPIIQLRVLRVREFRSTVFLNFILYFIVTGTLFILPIYMQELLRFSPTKAGTALVPRALVMMCFFPLVGLLFKRVPPKLLICAGLLAGLVSAVQMSHFTHETGLDDMTWPLVLQGLAVVLVLVPLSSVGLMYVDKHDIAAASSLDSTLRQFGGSLGVAVFASLLTHYQLRAWGEFRHHISLFKPLLYDRFNRLVITSFKLRGQDDSTALDSALRMMNSRVMLQVGAVTYRNLFEWVAVAFALLLIAVLILKVKKRVDA